MMYVHYTGVQVKGFELTLYQEVFRTVWHKKIHHVLHNTNFLNKRLNLLLTGTFECE